MPYLLDNDTTTLPDKSHLQILNNGLGYLEARIELTDSRVMFRNAPSYLICGSRTSLRHLTHELIFRRYNKFFISISRRVCSIRDASCVTRLVYQFLPSSS